jgi:hypothetical protein
MKINRCEKANEANRERRKENEKLKGERIRMARVKGGNATGR